jgi:hypothetical protein
MFCKKTGYYPTHAMKTLQVSHNWHAQLQSDRLVHRAEHDDEMETGPVIGISSL